MADADVVVVALGRTPFGRFEGALSALDGPTLGAIAMDEVVRRSRIPVENVDAVYAGVGLISSAMLTPVRQAVLKSSLPQTTPSTTIDRACCSGMTAIGLGFKDLRLGEARAVLCGGFEALSSTPYLWPRRRERRIGPQTAEDPLLLRGKVVEQPIAVYTGEESLRHGIDREQQDRWALRSHERYASADGAGYFDVERFAMELSGPKGAPFTFSRDESPRTDTTLEKLARLSPVHGGATVTAGNAPGLNDGAAFVMLCTRGFATAHGLAPLARLVDYVQVCGSPTSGTSTPAVAIRELARRQGRSPHRWDLIEINEAYAATPLVSTLVLAENDAAKAEALRERTNVHGGAVAIGHPLGASGARIAMTLINGLRRRGGGVGVAAICGGFGQGDAMLFEVA
jgi:acetyl-CoA C-acetyltransferase